MGIGKPGFPGAFYIIKDYKRYYPQGSLASTVLGFTGADNNGLEGLEYKYESVLAGTAGRIVTAQNGLGAEMPTPWNIPRWWMPPTATAWC